MKEGLIVWAAATAIAFFVGWAVVGFIAGEWSLSGWASRSWLVICGLTAAGVMLLDYYSAPP